LGRYVCFCTEIEPIETDIHFVFIVHISEFATTSNTARLAHRLLKNSSLYCWGEVAKPNPQVALKSQGLLLYPSENSVPIDKKLVINPTQTSLVIPDGSWRKAQKICRRVPELVSLQHLKLEPAEESRYKLRNASHKYQLCTIEATAYAARVLEGDRVGDFLMKSFSKMVERALFARGKQRFAKCLELSDSGC